MQRPVSGNSTRCWSTSCAWPRLGHCRGCARLNDDRCAGEAAAASGDALARSLACLGHPASWAAVGLLLANDHVLKVVAPSWLTGKLSDFAGLFFFPFLLAATLAGLAALAPRHRRPNERHIGATAWLLTAGWFAAMKTFGPVADATSRLASVAVRGPVADVVRDPSDLLALIALVPAWWLWRSRTPAGLSSGAFRRAAQWTALGLAAMATLASFPAELQSVRRLEVGDGDVYARIYSDPYSRNEIHPLGADSGLTWIGTEWRVTEEPVPDSVEIARRLAGDATLPKTLCVSKTTTCYRISKPERVEVSSDGGRSWNVGWRVPPGRGEFARRITRYGPYDPGPYDIAVVGSGAEHIVIVAMGRDGVLVRDSAGNWLRRPFLATEPTPWWPANVARAFQLTFGELLAAVLLACVVVEHHWRFVWREFADPAAATQREVRWVLVLIAAVPVFMVVMVRDSWTVMIERLDDDPSGIGLFLWALLLVPLSVLLLAAGRDLRRLRAMSSPAVAVRGIIGRSMHLGALTIVGVWLPFPLWAFGIIPLHELAVVLAGIVVLWTLNQAAPRRLE